MSQRPDIPTIGTPESVPTFTAYLIRYHFCRTSLGRHSIITKTDGAVCSSCHKPRPVSTHQRKLFLVAERLSWANSFVPAGARSQNEEALWAVNADLEIWEPAVEDDQIVIGGRLSADDACYPFRSEHEAEVVLRIVATADVLSKRSWEMWKRMINVSEPSECPAEQKTEAKTSTSERQPLGDVGGNSRWLPSAEHKTKVKGKALAIIESLDLSAEPVTTGLPTPPSSGHETALSAPRSKIDSLQDFYSILDKLERTSPMGAQFLEAYAERLRDEGCKDCWFKHNVLDDDQLEDESALVARPLWRKSGTTAAMFAR